MDPVTIAAIASLGGGLLKGLFGWGSQKKKADAERKAQEEALARARALWEAMESMRGVRLDALSGLMSNVQGSLAKGAPNYQIDPVLMEKLKTPRPFGGSLPADPRAGLGSALVGSIFGGIENKANAYLLDKETDNDAAIPDRRNVPDLSTNSAGSDICEQARNLGLQYPGCPPAGGALGGV